MNWFHRKFSTLSIADMTEKHLCIRCFGYDYGYCAIHCSKVFEYETGSYIWSPSPTLPCRDKNRDGYCPDYTMSTEEALYKLNRKIRGY